MRKKTLFCLGLLMSISGLMHTHAQYNQASPYTVPGTGYIETQALDVIASDGTSTVTLGKGTSTNYITLKKLDLHGVVLFNKVYTINTAGTYASPDKLIQTKDHGYLVVGTYHNSSVQTAPFAAKFDNAGNFLWLNYYPGTSIYVGGALGFSRTNIVLAGGDIKEDYVIETIAGPDDTSSHTQDVFVDALKIDSAGTLLWHNKYVPSFNRSGYSVIHDYAATLSFIPQGSSSHKYYNSSFLIAGTAEWWPSGPQYSLFYLGLDSMGNLIRNYTSYTVPDYPFNISSIFDPSLTTPAVCLGYTFGNPGIISPTTASTIALTKIDPFYNIFMTRYYCIPATYATENYGCSIDKTHDADSGYIIGTTSFYNYPLPPTYSGSATGMLKLSRTGSVDFYHQFDITQSWSLTTQVADVYISGLEYYALAGTTVNSGSSTSDIQIMATDVNGYTCDTTIQPVADTTYSATPIGYHYVAEAETGSFTDMLTDVGGYSVDNTCIVSDPSFRSSHAAAIVDSGNLNIYPTLISDNSNLIHIDYTATSDRKLEAEAYTIDGRLIGSREFSAQTGNNFFSWNLPLPCPGNYLLNVSSDNKSFDKTVRISKY